MADKTLIAWTDHTFNIAWGCTKVGPGGGYKNCYANDLAVRFGFDVWGPNKARRTFGEKHWSEPLKWDKAAAKAGETHRVFCSSMCDVFEDHPTIDAERQKLWPLIEKTPHLHWQLLTKRPERIASNLPANWDAIKERVWIGTSIESDECAFRQPHPRYRRDGPVHQLRAGPRPHRPRGQPPGHRLDDLRRRVRRELQARG